MQGRAISRSSARVLRVVALLGALLVATEGVRRLAVSPLRTVAGLLADGRPWGSLPLTLQVAAGCAAALAACWVWLVLCATVVAADAVRDGHDSSARRRLCPRLVRTLVLTSLGLAVGAGSAYADSGTRPGAGAGAGAGIAGLSLPDRVAAPPPRHLRVRPGDTLWAIAAQQLPDRAGDAAVAHAWPRIAAANADRVRDPDLIFPGTVLRVPDLGSALGKEGS